MIEQHGSPPEQILTEEKNYISVKYGASLRHVDVQPHVLSGIIFLLNSPSVRS